MGFREKIVIPKIEEKKLKPKKLEDHELGADRSQFFKNLKKVVTSPKPSEKRDEQPD